MPQPLPPYSYRDDPAVPAFPDDRPVIVFDGLCVMCSWWAQFVIRRDTQARFRLLAAQTPLGQALYRHYGLDPLNYQTNIVIEEGKAHFKSDTAISVLAGLGLPWSLATSFRLIPRPIRDWLYDRIARNRYRLFGQRETCLVATPDIRARFLT